jgi:DNA-binding sugar fermentation-stimulating protein
MLAFQEVDLKLILEKNSECKSRDFQNILTNYQKISGDIIRGSHYEVEVYKDKLRKMEKHCAELERKTELIYLNQKFQNEIVEDFIHFKKLAEVCAEFGGYYDPCKIQQIKI